MKAVNTTGDEDELIYYILGAFAFCLTGLPGLVFSGIEHVSLLTNITFAALIAAASYGWIQIMLSGRFLHKADKAHMMLAIGGSTITVAYFICSYMLKEYLESQRPLMLHLL